MERKISKPSIAEIDILKKYSCIPDLPLKNENIP